MPVAALAFTRAGRGEQQALKIGDRKALDHLLDLVVRGLACSKARHQQAAAGPDVLEVKEVPTPAPRRGEELVRVHAATVSRTDCGALSGSPFVYRFFVGFPRPRHTATGSDFAGEVHALGPGVRDLRVGDRVFGFDDNGAGTHTEYATFAADKAIVAIPSGLDCPQAAACAEGAHYAINFLRQLPVEAGRSALVNGATGAIGSAAVQLLAARGVYVTAVCTTPHLALVQGLGAARVIDYVTEDFTKQAGQYDLSWTRSAKARSPLASRSSSRAGSRPPSFASRAIE